VKEFGQEITKNKAIVSETAEKINKNKIELSKIKRNNDKSDDLNNSSSNNNDNNNNIDKKEKKTNLTKYSKLPTYQHYNNKKKNSNSSLIGQMKIKNGKVINPSSPLISSPVILSSIEKLNLYEDTSMKPQAPPILPPISKSENDDNNMENNKDCNTVNKSLINESEKERIYSRNNLCKSKSRSSSPEKSYILERKVFSSGDITSMIPTMNRRNMKNLNSNVRNANKKDSYEVDKETIQAFSERLYSFSELKEYESALFSNIKKRFDIEKGNYGEIPLKLKNHESLIVFNELINNTEMLLEKKIKLIKEIKKLLKSKSSV
ncbi:hypothetical protein BCR36DRAFT_294063, partial [Piromyces finnis]